MKRLMMLVLAGILLSSFQTREDGWKMFTKVKFISKFFKEYNEHFLVPVFDNAFLQNKGKQVILKGHFMPLEMEDVNTIILSKYPYSSCFFCGGAGPESVAEIVFDSKPPKLKADQIITVSGILDLNEKDLLHMNFILRNAKIEH